MNAHRLNPRLVPLFLLVLIHLAGLGLLLKWPFGAWPITLIGGQLRIASGLVNGEIAVIAAWAAWSQMTLAIRLPLAMLGSLLASFVLVAVIDFAPSYVPIEVTVITLASALVQCLTILGMCRGARAFGIDWRNVQSGQTPQRRRAQFHLWELLALMAAVALFLGSLRMLWPQDEVVDWTKISEDRLTLAGVLIVGNLLLTNTVVTIYWTPRGWLTNLAITLGLAVVITMLQWLAARGLDLRKSTFMFAWMNGAFLGWLLLSLGLVRLAGYRLERVRIPKSKGLRGSGRVFAAQD